MSDFIQCPECHAVYQEQELHVVAHETGRASGINRVSRVRCGRCQHVFDPSQRRAHEPGRHDNQSAARMWENDVLILPDAKPSPTDDKQGQNQQPGSVTVGTRHRRSNGRTQNQPKPRVKPKPGLKTRSKGRIQTGDKTPHPNQSSKQVDAVLPDHPIDNHQGRSPRKKDRPQSSGQRREARVLSSSSRPKYRPIKILQGLFVLIVIFGLLVGIGLQVYLNYWHELAQQSWARPQLERICEFAGCTVPARSDPSRIDLVDTGILSHPTLPGALRVTLALTNQATFDQAYPRIQLSLTDHLGAVVGRRSYRPREYLVDPARLLHSRVLTPVELDLLRPPFQAIGYEVELLLQ